MDTQLLFIHLKQILVAAGLCLLGGSLYILRSLPINAIILAIGWMLGIFYHPVVIPAALAASWIIGAGMVAHHLFVLRRRMLAD